MKQRIFIIFLFLLPSCASSGNGEIIAAQMEKLYSAGHKYKKNGQFIEAREEYSKLMNLAEEVNDGLNHALAREFVASTYYALKDYNKAIELYKQSAGFYKKEGYESYLASTYIMVELSYSALKQYQKALEFALLMVDIATKLEDKPRLAPAYIAVGNNFWYLGKYDQGIESKEKALAIYKELGDDSKIASTYNDIGLDLSDINQKQKALHYLMKALEINRKLGKEHELAETFDWIGIFYRESDDYDRAITNFEQALRLYEKFKNKKSAAQSLQDIGLSYQHKGNTQKALDLYKQALKIHQEQKNESGSLSVQGSIARVHEQIGRYDKAIEVYERNLKVYKIKKDALEILASYQSIAGVYSSWHKYDIAIKFLKQALVLVDELRVDHRRGMKDMLSVSLGKNFLAIGETDKAFDYLSSVVQSAKENGDKLLLATGFKLLAGVYRSKKQYEKELELEKQSLKIYTEIGMEPGIARGLLEIGITHFLMKNPAKAREYLNRAIKIARKINSPGIWKDINESIGALYIREGKFEEAGKYLTEAVKVVENLRKTASGTIRRDFLETKITLYKFLAFSHLISHNLPESFLALERSHSRLLLDKLLNAKKGLQIPTVNQIQNQMGHDSAILAYGRLNPKREGSETLFEYAIISDAHQGYIANTSTLSSQTERIGTVVSKWDNDQRGIKTTKSFVKEKSKNYLENLVRYYQFILANPSNKNDTAIKEIGRALYDLLIKPLLPVIRGKKNLLIIPDGILSFIPFEVLVDEKGRYLVEEFNVGYVQSMGVLNSLRGRKYEEERKPMLAFGGALYEQTLSNQNIVETDIQLSDLTANTLDSLNQNDTRSASDAFARLGYASWANLPGSKVEVEAIKALIKNSKTIIGEDVNEANIKEMSASGELSNYEVLHFATHGVTVPNFPELSSIVLSQNDNAPETEDGYLRMEEIAKLKIRAEFVNLSACQTGRGKLFAGEGVVGLAHSFLLAGANALSVSLWNVEDESTVKFMVGLYKLVEEKGMTYFQAMNEMKRSFIKGKIHLDPFDPATGLKLIKDEMVRPNKLSHPFYWAPFVYYGVN